MAENSPTPPGWIDEPYADPQIQKDYEAALGAFLVVFNAIENTINDIIVLALQKSGRADILKQLDNDSFNRKLTTLDLISVAYPTAVPQSVTNQLRNLATQRNRLAHGHFDQNPFDGTYQVVTSRSGPKPIPVPQIQTLTEHAETVWEKLRFADAYFFFYDLVAENSS